MEGGGGEKMCSMRYQRRKPSLKTIPQVPSSTMGWSDMLPEVLDIIARKHIVFFEDYHSFAGVCKSWHTVALKAAKEVAKGNGPPSWLPSLMLSEEVEDEKWRRLRLLSTETIRDIQLPEVYGKLCLSSCGWLVTVADDYSSQLINPLSREIFVLPKVDTFPGSDIKKWDDSIKKLLFIAQLSLVIVCWGPSIKLGYCRIGDDKWTHIDNCGSGIMDITYYDGRVYILDFLFQIQEWDVHREDPTKMLCYDSLVPEEAYAGDDEELHIAYILGLDDGERKRLLLVNIKGVVNDDIDCSCDIDDCSCEDETHRLQVWDIDLESGEWSEVNDLGKKTLFVGHSSSFWIEDTTRLIKGNCIYFRDGTSVYPGCENGVVGDMGIYHVSKKIIEPHFTGKSCSRLNPPIWLQSI